jgi:hypothetical protein
MARIFVLSLLGAIGVGLGLAALVAVTRIRQVVVQSSDPKLAEDVRQAIRIPAWANLTTSKLSLIAAQAERVPGVKRADFERKLPDRLVLTVEPRVPRLAFAKSGRHLLVDDEGACIAWTTRPDSTLLRVKGMEVNAEAGQHISGEWFVRSLTVAKALADAERFRPWTFDVGYPAELSVIAGSGARGIVGLSDDLERRVSLFVEALQEYEKQGKPIGLMELRTERPIVWEEGQRPDQVPAAQP